MGRRKGKPMYAHKSVAGSYWITKEADRKKNAAAKRTGKSESDVIDHCLRVAADGLTREQADAIAAAEAKA